jgi:hypothetical protein
MAADWQLVAAAPTSGGELRRASVAVVEVAGGLWLPNLESGQWSRGWLFLNGDNGELETGQSIAVDHNDLFVCQGRMPLASPIGPGCAYHGAQSRCHYSAPKDARILTHPPAQPRRGAYGGRLGEVIGQRRVSWSRMLRG